MRGVERRLAKSKFENGFISLSYSNYQTDGFTALEKDIANPEDDGFSSSEILINSETDLRNGTKLKFNILKLESDVGGNPEKPIYIMHIEGFADCSHSSLEQSIKPLINEKKIVIHLVPIDTMMG